MMIVTPIQARDMEKEAYALGFKAKDFMQNAGNKIAEQVINFVEQEGLEKKCLLLCGKGNNAGDAYRAGFLLLEERFSVGVLSYENKKDLSPLCQEMADNFFRVGGKRIDQLDDFVEDAVILDALFGTGFKGALSEPYLSLVKEINTLNNPVISIDIPSGLDGETGDVKTEAICADLTLSLGLPKQGFFLNQGWNYVGDILALDFGLPKEIEERLSASFELLQEKSVIEWLPPIKPNRHKYEAGALLIFAGSAKYGGSAYLSSKAAYRTGSGLVTLLTREGVNPDVPELIKIQVNDLQEQLKTIKHHALLVGPGIGLDPKTKTDFQQLIKGCRTSLVIDADGLNILAESEAAPPRDAVLTPHFQEMCRLLHNPKLSQNGVTEEFIALVQVYVEKHNCIVVLKGGPTFILSPKKVPMVCTRGGPGMATAGTGDVLAGIIGSLLSQGVNPYQAACLGVYLHGLAGEYAEEELTAYSMMAHDVIDNIAEAYSRWF